MEHAHEDGSVQLIPSSYYRHGWKYLYNTLYVIIFAGGTLTVTITMYITMCLGRFRIRSADFIMHILVSDLLHLLLSVPIGLAKLNINRYWQGYIEKCQILYPAYSVTASNVNICGVLVFLCYLYLNQKANEQDDRSKRTQLRFSLLLSWAIAFFIFAPQVFVDDLAQENQSCKLDSEESLSDMRVTLTVRAAYWIGVTYLQGLGAAAIFLFLYLVHSYKISSPDSNHVGGEGLLRANIQRDLTLSSSFERQSTIETIEEHHQAEGAENIEMTCMAGPSTLNIGHDNLGRLMKQESLDERAAIESRLLSQNTSNEIKTTNIDRLSPGTNTNVRRAKRFRPRSQRHRVRFSSTLDTKSGRRSYSESLAHSHWVKITLIITISHLLSVLPQHVFLYSYYFGNLNSKMYFFHVYELASLSALLNSIANSIAFCLFHPVINRRFRAMLTKRWFTCIRRT